MPTARSADEVAQRSVVSMGDFGRWPIPTMVRVIRVIRVIRDPGGSSGMRDEHRADARLPRQADPDIRHRPCLAATDRRRVDLAGAPCRCRCHGVAGGPAQSIRDPPDLVVADTRRSSGARSVGRPPAADLPPHTTAATRQHLADRRDHPGQCRVGRSADHGVAAGPGPRGRHHLAADRRCHLADQRDRVRHVVLEPRPRRAGGAGPGVEVVSRLPLPADDGRPTCRRPNGSRSSSTTCICRSPTPPRSAPPTPCRWRGGRR